MEMRAKRYGANDFANQNWIKLHVDGNPVKDFQARIGIRLSGGALVFLGEERTWFFELLPGQVSLKAHQVCRSFPVDSKRKEYSLGEYCNNR